MRQSFNRFAIRFPTAVLLGLALIAFHGHGGLLSIPAPRYGSPWELSKLVYWPLLSAMLLTGRSRAAPWDAAAELPVLVVAPPALFLLYWLLTPLELSTGVSVLLWFLVLAAAQLAALLLCGRKKRVSAIWWVLAAALACVYVLFTFLPPLWGPFLDPTDVAAMAAIPV